MCVSASNAQGVAASQPTPGTPEFLDHKMWSDLGKPTEKDRGFSLFSRNIQPKTDSLFELWVKIVPSNQSEFNRKHKLPSNTAYAIQYATVDCGRRQIVMEKTAAYNSANTKVDAAGSELVRNQTRARVRSGSINEVVFDYICLKLQ
jgi:hypothetical protein